MPKAILVNNYGNGGAEKVAATLANYYYDSGVEIKSLTLNNRFDYVLNENVANNNFSLGFSGVKSLLSCALKLRKKIKQEDICVVQSHLFYSNYVNSLSRVLGAKHKVVLVHCVAFSTKFKKNKASYWFHLVAIKLLYRIADVHVFKSKSMLHDYKSYVRVAESKVIYNPVNVSNSLATPKQLRNPVVKIAVVGRFHVTKRHMDVVRLAGHLGNQFEFHFFGDGPQFEAIKEAAKSVKFRCRFYGRVSDPSAYFGGMDIYLGCSEAEGFPNAIIEAMAMGLPIIHSDCKSGPREILMSDDKLNLQEVIRSGEFQACDYGILFSVGDIAAMASAISYLTKGAQIYTHYSKCSIERFKQINSLDSCGEYLATLSVK